MKNVWKCVASLTVIALVCTALLLVCNIYLPKRTTTTDYGALIGEEGASFEELDVGALGLDAAYADRILEVRRATSGGKVGALVVKSKGEHRYGSFALFVGAQVVGGRVEILGVRLDDTSLEGGQLWSNPFSVESNFTAFVGSDPTKMTTADLVTSSATLTTQAMIDAVRYAYLAVGKVGGGDTTPAEVKLARQYFTTEDGFTVTDANKVFDVTAERSFDVYEVTLTGIETAYLFVDKSEGAHYDFDAETGGLTANADGAFYQDGATVGVWRDGTAMKFAGVSTTGQGEGYVSAELGFLLGKPLGKLSVTGYTAVTGTEGTEVTVTESNAAAAAGAALVAELNNRLSADMESWIASDSEEMKFAKTVFAQALKDGDEIVSSVVDSAASTATVTVYKVGVKNGENTRYGAIFVSEQPSYFTFDYASVAIAVSDAENANFTLTRVTAGVLDDKFFGIDVKGEYKGNAFFPLKDTAKNGIAFGLIKVEGYEAVTGDMGSAIVSGGATGTGVATAATLNGLYNSVMQSYMTALAGGNQ